MAPKLSKIAAKLQSLRELPQSLPTLHIPSGVACLVRAAVSGAAAEVFVNLTLYPIDTWTVRLQFKSFRPKPLANLKSIAAPVLRPRSSISGGGGGGGVFAGFRAGILGNALDAFVFTLVYEGVRGFLSRLSRPHERKAKANYRVAVALMAGAVASVTSSAFDAPFTLARDRIRLGLQPNIQTAWRAATCTGGWRALYAGARTTMMRDVPVEAAEFASFDFFKYSYSIICGPPHPFARLVLGAASGALTGILSTPLDLAVTRVRGNPHKYSGLFATLRKVVQEEGFPAIFRAVPQRAMREAASSALFFLIYDGLKGSSDENGGNDKNKNKI